MNWENLVKLHVTNDVTLCEAESAIELYKQDIEKNVTFHYLCNKRLHEHIAKDHAVSTISLRLYSYTRYVTKHNITTL